MREVGCRVGSGVCRLKTSLWRLRRARPLTLARDCFGKKSLYHGFAQGRGSESEINRGLGRSSDRVGRLRVAATGVWQSALARLLESPEQRLQMGNAGRAAVEQTYSLQVQVQVQAPILAQIFQQAAGQGR